MNIRGIDACILQENDLIPLQNAKELLQNLSISNKYVHIFT